RFSVCRGLSSAACICGRVFLCYSNDLCSLGACGHTAAIDQARGICPAGGVGLEETSPEGGISSAVVAELIWQQKHNPYAEGLPPAPRLQVDPATDLENLRKAEAAVLNSYGWVDRKAGIVRIPIDRAMEVLAERGLPARSRPEAEQRGGR
ncbi:MAG: hypothetical protein K6T59_14635, partial [Bryobacteraceae bacterium]|nr:hypothetical protein [Bryobacteraceae bacterium]